jgi:hypothetical protein
VTAYRVVSLERRSPPARLGDAATAAANGARIDHVTVSANGSLAALTLLGSHEGGAFEDVRVVVREYSENGKIRRRDIYPLEQLEQARARFAQLRG